MKEEMLREFNLDEVTLTDAYLLNSFEKETEYLKQYDADRLVAGFLETNELMPKAPKYPGWESTEIRGHTLGHYLTAVSQAVKTSGDQELKEKLDYIVDELERAQAAGGYLSAFPEELFDNVENRKPCWVPWYTMDKIIAGLTACYTLAGNEKALAIVSRLGDWVYDRTSKWSEDTQNTVLAVEYGGMNEAMYRLYRVTKNEKHLFAAHQFDEKALFTPVKEGKDILNGKHANTTIPKFLGSLSRYVSKGLQAEDEFYYDAARTFFDLVLKNHTYVTGGNSEWEHFGEPGILDAERTNCNCETCNTYNMLKLSRELFKITKDRKYSDFYENTFLNAIMSSQNPETGMSMYFQPMATGFFKVYGTPFDSFWCCTGTGMENFTKTGDSIYFKSEDTVFVNQFIGSKVNWAEKNLTIEQKCTFDDVASVKLTVTGSCDEETHIAVRIPDWCDERFTLRCAGSEVFSSMQTVADISEAIAACRIITAQGNRITVENGCIVITGKFDGSMEFEFEFYMEIKAYPLPDNSHAIALKYGPYVLSAAMGCEDMTESKTGVDVTIATRNIAKKDFITISESLYDNTKGAEEKEAAVKEFIKEIRKHVVKTPGKIEFHLTDTDSDELVFTPHYRQHKERYGIYWNIVTKDSDELKKHILKLKEAGRKKSVQIDAVPLGNDQYELLHNIKGEDTGAGTFNGLMLRHAWGVKGWFSYDMAVDSSVKNYLLVKYFSPNAGRTFNIYIDDELLIEETIKNKIPEDFYDEYYEIPAAMIKGKEKINVKFTVRGDSFAGGIFDMLCIVKDYEANAEIKTVSFEDENGRNIGCSIEGAELVLDGEKCGSMPVYMKLETMDEYSLVYVDGVLIDESEARIIDAGRLDGCEIKVTAQNHKDTKLYKVRLA